MADAVRATVADLEGLVAVMKELGLVTKNQEKSDGIFEKRRRSIKKTFEKSPFGKAKKSLMGYFKSFKQLGEYTVKARSAGDEKLAQMEEEMTGLTKLTATMVFHTGIAKIMNKTAGKTNNIFARLLMSILSLVSIFAMVAFAFGILLLAFQGADSPILDLTDGLWGIDNAAKGVVMAFTGEGEGGLLGAVNIIVAAIAVAGVSFMLFGGPIALVAGGAMLIVGTFQLMKKQFDDNIAAFAAATVVTLVLVAAFIKWKFAALAAKTVSMGAINATVGSLLLGVAIIVGGLTMLYLFATGKVSGWVGWAVALLGAGAIAAGLAIFLGLTWPVALIIAAIALVVAIVYRYWDEIYAFFKPAIDVIIIAAKAVYAAFLVAVDVAAAIVMGVVKAVWFVISGIFKAFVFTFKLLWKVVWGVIQLGVKLVIGIFKILSWPFVQAFKGIKWFFSWLMGMPGKIKDAFIGGVKALVNAIAGIWNSTAGKLQFDIPDWVPVIGGGSFGIPKIPLLAKGGIVNSPTLAMIGEDGPEAVVPLTKKNNPQGIGLGGGNGPITLNINVGGVTDRTDKRALAREIGDAIRDEMHRSGRSMGTRRSAL